MRRHDRAVQGHVFENGLAMLFRRVVAQVQEQPVRLREMRRVVRRAPKDKARLHAGQVIVADGTPEAAVRLERVLTTDPGMGVVRHADAGYPEAVEFAKTHGVKIPMLK